MRKKWIQNWNFLRTNDASATNRFREHFKDGSNLYEHLKESNHTTNNNSLTNLRVSFDKRTKQVLEKYEISNQARKKNQTFILNLQLDVDNAANVSIEKCCNCKKLSFLLVPVVHNLCYAMLCLYLFTFTSISYHLPVNRLLITSFLLFFLFYLNFY